VHELSLASSMLEIISAKVNDKRSLRNVHVIMGPLSGVWPDALQFGFEELARTAGYCNAKLVITKIPAICVCTACGKRYQIDDVEKGCTSCGALERCIESGSEFQMDSLEVDDGE
jgi:hydrogenase nickel incorporation protein HypA/HybF